MCGIVICPSSSKIYGGLTFLGCVTFFVVFFLCSQLELFQMFHYRSTKGLNTLLTRLHKEVYIFLYLTLEDIGTYALSSKLLSALLTTHANACAQLHYAYNKSMPYAHHHQ